MDSELSLFPDLAPTIDGRTNQVRQHRNVTFSHQRKMSLLSKRIMARVLEQIQRDDLTLRESYQVAVGQLVEGTDLKSNNAYTWAKAALDELNNVKWSFEDLERKHFYQRSLLIQDGGPPSDVLDGVITLRLNPGLAPYFLQLAGEYTLYELDGYMGLQSWYAMRLFEILAHYHDTGWWKVDLEEYRRIMDCAPELDRLGKPMKDKKGNLKMKYRDTKNLIIKTILVAQKELEYTPYAFTFQEEKSLTPGKGRSKVTGFYFELKTRKPRGIPPSWFESRPHATAIARLRAYKVTDANMAKYLKPLTLAGVNLLLSEWDRMRTGPRRIDKPESYCNAVIVRAGKKAIEEAKERERELRLEAKNVQQQLFPGASTMPRE